jgi:hypothetical protein
MSTQTHTGALFEITLDGTPRTYRVLQEHALETGRLLKQRHPHSVVVVRDMRTDAKTAIPSQQPATFTAGRSA